MAEPGLMYPAHQAPVRRRQALMRKNPLIMLFFMTRRAMSYRFNMDTLAAMQEAEDIRSGRIQAKVYHSFDEIMRDLDAD